jgi:hypothetical protein
MAREIEWATGISFEEAKQCSLDDWRAVVAALCPFDTTLPPVTEVVLTSLPPLTPLEAICYGLGIRMVPTSRRRKPGETHARGTMERILEEQGEDHLLFVLRCIRETKPNHEALSSETIASVSDVLVQRPDWAQRPSELFDAFDHINLDAEREISVQRRPWPIRATLRARIYLKLEGVMDVGSA